MAKDYKVKFTGEDDVSDVIDKVKEGLKGLGEQTSKLESISERFERINQSSAPLKKKLRELNVLMAQMNLDGINDTDIFLKITQRAGELKDAIDDAAFATKAFSSDTADIDAVIDGFTGLAGATSVVTGAMGLFSLENENVEKAILKVQSALSILNGLQSVSNVLNENSAFRLKMKNIQMLIASANTSTHTVATTANTAGIAGNTVAVAVNAFAQKGFNLAKAIGKALLGDFTGLLLVGGIVLMGYAGYTAFATKEEEKNAEAIKNSDEALDRYNSTLASTYANLMTTYTVLRNEWSKLSSEHQKTLWIDQNKNKFEELGVSVNNAADAENVFNGNTNTVVENIIKRAKAAAMLAQLTEEYRKQMELTDKITNADKAAEARNQYEVNDEIQNTSHYNVGYGYVANDGSWHYHQKGIEKLSKLKWYDNSSDIKDARKQLVESQRRSNDLVNSLKEQTTVSFKSGTKTTPKRTPSKQTNRNKPKVGVKEEIIPENTLKYYRNQLSDLENLRDVTPITDKAKLAEINSSITKLKNQIEETEIQLGITAKKEDIQKFATGSIAALNEELSNLEDRLTNENLDLATRIAIETDKQTLQNKIDSITNGDISIKATVEPVRIIKGSIEDKRASYDNFNNRTTQISEDYTKGIISKSEMKAQYEALAKEISESGINIKFNADLTSLQTELSRFKGNADSLLDGIGAVDSVVGGLNTLGNSIISGANAWEVFMNTVSATASVLEAVNTVMTILNATKMASASVDTAATTTMVANSTAKMTANSGEAISGAVASGAKMPFPLNLIAIAAGVSAVMAGLKMVGAFADGGIIGGNSFHGDSLFAKVNAGEMILNSNQQSNLFSMLNNGKASSVGNVQFKISGKELVGVLNNYNTKTNKIR